MTTNHPSFREAVKFWTKLGFISFGGPAGQIAIMHEYVVDKKKWISESKFLHALNYCMLLPGPEAQQLATYLGWLMHGVKGGLAAGLLFILPSVFILLGLSAVYVSYGDVPFVHAVFHGLKPAVLAIIIGALIKIGKRSLKENLHYFIAVAAFAATFFFNVPFPLILIGALLVSIVFKYFSNNDEVKQVSKTSFSFKTLLTENGFSIKTPIKTAAIGISLWLIPFVFFWIFSAEFEFWKKLSLFFTKAALVTFGGAYAVLPYVAQVSVEKYQWLSNLQMIDGLALGETTPGPLIMVLAFVGFMAGYNHFGHSILFGTIGLFTTTFYTFLPSFLFIFIGAPIIERTHENKHIKEYLTIVTSAVVGVILNLAIYLTKAVVIKPTNEIDYLAVFWMMVSVIVLQFTKMNMAQWIGISAVFGLVYLL